MNQANKEFNLKKVLIIVFSNLKTDARVTRQVEFLKETYSVTVVCHEAFPSSDIDVLYLNKPKLTFIRKVFLSLFLITGFHEIACKLLHNYSYLIPELRNKNFDLIIANDIETMPMAWHVAKSKTKIFLDAHEYSPKQFEDRLYWQIFFKRFYYSLCKNYIPKVCGMSTINNGLAQEYLKEFNIKPTIITNAAEFNNLSTNLRTRYPIRLVHHGIFTISRQPKIMLDMMRLLDDRFTLDLIYLVPESASAQSKEYFKKFKEEALKNGKVKVLPALRRDEIVESLNMNYDIGIILVPPVNFNYQHGLPNKLYECIQGRIAMAVGPLHEIARVVSDYKLGVVSEEFTAESLARELRKLSLDDVNAFKANANLAASVLNAEQNKKILLALVERHIDSAS